MSVELTVVIMVGAFVLMFLGSLAFVCVITYLVRGDVEDSEEYQGEERL